MPIPRPPRYVVVFTAILLFWPTVGLLLTAARLGKGDVCRADPRGLDAPELSQRWSWRDIGLVCVARYGDGRVAEWVER